MAKKSGNLVILDGKFMIEQVGRVKDGTMYRPYVSFRVCTEDEKYGGHHKVLAYDQLAEEIVATAKSFDELVASGRVIPDPIGGEKMEVSIRGRLRTYTDSTVVIADSVRFHTYEVVRMYANHIRNKVEDPVSERT